MEDSLGKSDSKMIKFPNYYPALYLAYVLILVILVVLLHSPLFYLASYSLESLNIQLSGWLLSIYVSEYFLELTLVLFLLNSIQVLIYGFDLLIYLNKRFYHYSIFMSYAAYYWGANRFSRDAQEYKQKAITVGIKLSDIKKYKRLLHDNRLGFPIWLLGFYVYLLLLIVLSVNITIS